MIVSDIEHMMQQRLKQHLLLLQNVSGMEIKPTHVKVKNIVSNYNLSATGFKKLPSSEAWEVRVRAIHPIQFLLKNSICFEMIIYYSLGNVVTLLNILNTGLIKYV